MVRRKAGRQSESGFLGLGGVLGGLGTFLEKLGELAEKGEELRQAGEVHGTNAQGGVRGVYGFSVKVGLGDEGVQVEPFGNVRKDEETGETVVDEVREPLVDVFEEEDHVLVVAEMPGVGEEDIQVELKEDILTLSAARGAKKYRKEVLLPAAFPPERMSRTCRNGILEVKCAK